MRLKINPEAIESLMAVRHVTKQDVAEASGGTITRDILRHALSVSPKMKPEHLETLAGILGCKVDDLLDRASAKSMDIPYKINKLLANLFIRSSTGLMPLYSQLIDDLKATQAYRNLLYQTGLLFELVSRDRETTDIETVITKVIDVIRTKCCPGGSHYSALLTFGNGLYDQLHQVISQEGDGYNDRQTELAFLYGLLLFKTIFTEELVGSALQFGTVRASKNVHQHFLLANDIESLTAGLADKILHLDQFMPISSSQQSPTDDPGLEKRMKLFDDLVLLLAACKKAVEHFEAEEVASQCVNRAQLHAIIERIKKLANYYQVTQRPLLIDTLSGSRFWQRYTLFKAISQNEKKDDLSEVYDFLKKYWKVNWLMNQLTPL